MVFTEPLKENNYIVHPGDIQTLNLSFAVWLVDDHTKEKPIGNIKVLIEEIDKKAIRNPSGYYFFTDLEARDYTLSIKSEFYLPEKKLVNMSSSPFSDPKEPVVEVDGKPEIILKPNPEYPFPANATLIRGQIKSNSEEPLAGIKVGVEEKNMESFTDSRGEFVLYFTDIEKTADLTLVIKEEIEDSITVKEGKTVIKNFNIVNN